MRRRSYTWVLRAAVAGALMQACGGDASTAPATAQLIVPIGGLPAGVPSAVTVTGPNGFRQVLDSSRTLTALVAGSYTITPGDVVTGVTRYAGVPASESVTVGVGAVASAGPIGYRIASASLSVAIAGLPSGTAGSVMMSGPHNYSKAIGANLRLDLLEPGPYIITAGDVQAMGKTYRAVVKTSKVELFASLSVSSTTVEYGAGGGSLAVTLSGLPTTTDASATITGPGGFSRHLTGSAVMGNLEAGSYTIVADTVGGSLTTYVPAPLRQVVDIVDGPARSAAVAYGSTPLVLGLRLFADSLTQPVFLAAPDGDARQFIVERPGRVRLVIDGKVRPTPFLDIRSRVNNAGERGMLSMAFDPRYASTGVFYVYYVDLSGNVVIEAFNSTPGAEVATGTAGVVISIPHGGSEHHGGQIAFGPDGMLYLAPGDGGCCGDPNNNAQNLNVLLGKVLRIDVRSQPYTIPAGNPFTGRADARAEIWASGLRNPWRFSFDPPSGMLYIADVGQDAREEVDAVRAADAGLNYGWRFMAGTNCYNPASLCTAGRTLTPPVLDYAHPAGCSVIGGYVYRGVAMPELVGHYLYADFCGGWLRSFRMTGLFALEQTTWAGITLKLVNSFGRDGAGELYMIADTRVWTLVRSGR